MSEQTVNPAPETIALLSAWNGHGDRPVIHCPACGNTVNLFGKMEKKIFIICNCGYEWFET